MRPVSTFAFEDASRKREQRMAVSLYAQTQVVVSEPFSDWREDVVSRLNELAALPRDWNGYGAGPVKFETASFALRVLESLCSTEIPAPQIVPGSNGDLQIEWHIQCIDIELHVLKPNEVHAWSCRRTAAGDVEQSLTLQNIFTDIAPWIRELRVPDDAHCNAAA